MNSKFFEKQKPPVEPIDAPLPFDYRNKRFLITRGPNKGEDFECVGYVKEVFEITWKQGLEQRMALCVEYCIMATLLSLPTNEEPLLGRILGVKRLIHPSMLLVEQEETTNEDKEQADGA